MLCGWRRFALCSYWWLGAAAAAAASATRSSSTDCSIATYSCVVPSLSPLGQLIWLEPHAVQFSPSFVLEIVALNDPVKDRDGCTAKMVRSSRYR